MEDVDFSMIASTFGEPAAPHLVAHDFSLTTSYSALALIGETAKRRGGFRP